MAKHERYAEYKDSGIPWLGQVPAHWDLKRADAVLEESRRSVPPERFKDKEVIHYSIPNIQSYGDGQLEPGEDIASAKILVDRELLLVSKLNPRKATVLIAKPRESLTLCSGEFIPLKASDCDLKFAEYVYLSEASRQRLDSLVRSVTRSHQRATPEDVVKMPWAWPPLEEQQAIAAWLDERTARIDTLIAKKQRLIELLQEKRQAVISKAVTRGLEPHVKLKDSGIPWLGEVPEHWEVKRLKHLSEFVTSGSRGWAEHYADEGAVFIRIGNLHRSRIDLRLDEIQHVDPPQTAEVERTKALPNDLLISITAFLGTVGIVPKDLGEAYVNQHTALVRPDHRLCFSRFVAYWLSSSIAQQQFRAASQGGTKEGMNLQEVRDLIIIQPEVDQQRLISEKLDAELSVLDTLVAKAEIAVERLHEYRTSLISAAVTGQIKVC